MEINKGACLQCPKCNQYRPIYKYKGITKTYEMTYCNICMNCKRNVQLKDKQLVKVLIFGKSKKGIQVMLLQRIHPQKPYFGMMQGTGGKVEVYVDEYGIETLEKKVDAAIQETQEELGIYLDETKLQKIWSETVLLEWTTRRCEIQEAIYNVTLSIFIYPWNWIQKPLAVEPDKSSN
ncbi:hypothetical protein C2G38_2144743 [Gigaspora rosea]|uniref:Nudix hydrolase domain-containing protein n=1 Tax=Gigaspora rosea TaxID=44941 RepID=A0A397US61_9GLOM|nr:hypothetical protein C2G38_2144743 [Gigaspora rosea]